MLLEKIPMEILVPMLNYARNESALHYSQAMQQAGKEPTPEDLKAIDRSADIIELFIVSLMKQLAFYEAATEKATSSD